MNFIMTKKDTKNTTTKKTAKKTTGFQKKNRKLVTKFWKKS